MSILGRNGVGKSPLIKCILNLLTLDKGSILLSGRAISRLHATDMAAIAGYVPQIGQMAFPFSVFEFVLMGRAPHVSLFRTPDRWGMETTVLTLEKIGIAYLAQKSIADISGGEKQMAVIARAQSDVHQAPKETDAATVLTFHIDFVENTITTVGR